MSTLRPPLIGVANVVRFNWPLYAAAGAGVAGALGLGAWRPRLRSLTQVAALLGAAPAVLSLAVSHWVYDRSDLYRFGWLIAALRSSGFRQNNESATGSRVGRVEAPWSIVNFTAGFDETSALLADRFPATRLQIFDFYDPERHTESSIARARRAYPRYPGTQVARVDQLALPAASVDVALALLSAHEIRHHAGRVVFFSRLAEALAPGGRIVVAEHLRDVPNLLAYGVGALHFHGRDLWLTAFAEAGLALLDERRVTPFVVAFTLARLD